MNLLFSVILIVSSTIMFVSSPEILLNTYIDGVKNSLSLFIKLFCIYSIWLSIMNVWKELKFDKCLGKALLKPIKKLFPNEEYATYSSLSVNVSANLLGMGGVGTPSGIDAVEKMKHKKNRITLLVLNSTSIQLIPSTIIALRSGYNAKISIILPSLICTFFTTFIGLTLTNILEK